ncbi:hypothetical protein M407DRAFT_33015 [Tulasnella calospora MUT 4182]|uniref:Uncharacterized protein n=1 Tax=Tulasnella calospora MUT 4182 TaxID=1051891 RepID=A0A0C3PRQ7_9AGAM|nr:hypothetical protein M407DRAFT_33015 [Tulasnella calospora MUT 4182]
MSTSTYLNPYSRSVPLCEYCGIRPKFGNFSYCGKTCATQDAKSKPYATPQATTQWTSTDTGQEQSQGYSNTTSVPTDSKATTDPNLCEASYVLVVNCLKRVKSSEQKDDGEMVTHRYCGIMCYEASRNVTVPASMIPAPAPAPAPARTDSIGLREESAIAPIGRKVLLMMQERWKSDTVSMTKLKSIYRVDLPGSVYRRFDFSLQANDGCTVVTTYYGGKAACDIANDNDPAPCNSESCSVCDAIRNAFSHLIYGASSTDGKHGPGIYTFKNPALAHHRAAASAWSPWKRSSNVGNFVLIQCRVVTRGDSTQVTNPYAVRQFARESVDATWVFNVAFL